MMATTSPLSSLPTSASASGSTVPNALPTQSNATNANASIASASLISAISPSAQSASTVLTSAALQGGTSSLSGVSSSLSAQPSTSSAAASNSTSAASLGTSVVSSTSSRIDPQARLISAALHSSSSLSDHPFRKSLKSHGQELTATPSAPLHPSASQDSQGSNSSVNRSSRKPDFSFMAADNEENDLDWFLSSSPTPENGGANSHAQTNRGSAITANTNVSTNASTASGREKLSAPKSEPKRSTIQTATGGSGNNSGNNSGDCSPLGGFQMLSIGDVVRTKMQSMASNTSVPLSASFRIPRKNANQSVNANANPNANHPSANPPIPHPIPLPHTHAHAHPHPQPSGAIAAPLSNPLSSTDSHFRSLSDLDVRSTNRMKSDPLHGYDPFLTSKDNEQSILFPPALATVAVDETTAADRLSTAPATSSASSPTTSTFSLSSSSSSCASSGSLTSLGTASSAALSSLVHQIPIWSSQAHVPLVHRQGLHAPSLFFETLSDEEKRKYFRLLIPQETVEQDESCLVCRKKKKSNKFRFSLDPTIMTKKNNPAYIGKMTMTSPAPTHAIHPLTESIKEEAATHGRSYSSGSFPTNELKAATATGFAKDTNSTSSSSSSSPSTPISSSSFLLSLKNNIDVAEVRVFSRLGRHSVSVTILNQYLNLLETGAAGRILTGTYHLYAAPQLALKIESDSATRTVLEVNKLTPANALPTFIPLSHQAQTYATATAHAQTAAYSAASAAALANATITGLQAHKSKNSTIIATAQPLTITTNSTAMSASNPTSNASSTSPRAGHSTAHSLSIGGALAIASPGSAAAASGPASVLSVSLPPLATTPSSAGLNASPNGASVSPPSSNSSSSSTSLSSSPSAGVPPVVPRSTKPIPQLPEDTSKSVIHFDYPLTIFLSFAIVCCVEAHRLLVTRDI